MGRKIFKLNRKKEENQKGQGLVEFALILPMLLLLLLVPMDLYRVINTKMILNTAASESIAKLSYQELAAGELEEKVLKIVDEYFGDKLDRGKVKIIHLEEKNLEEKDYTYYVYSSELAGANPDDHQGQFENRKSHYKYKEIELQMSYNVEPITLWGGIFIGKSFDVKTPIYRKNIYMSGYNGP